MDELKISSKFMRTIISKLISKTIKKKVGYDIKIQLNDLNVKIIDEHVYVSLSANAEMNTNELKKVTKVIGIEEEEL